MRRCARCAASRAHSCARIRSRASVHATRATHWLSRWPMLRCSCPRASATTQTSTHRFTTPRTSAACSAPTTHCCPTTSGCPSATTAARRRWCRAERQCGGRSGRRRTTRRPCRASDRASGSTTSSRSEHSLALAIRSAHRSRLATRRRTSRDCAWSTTGQRATCRHGSTSPWAPSSPRISQPRFLRGS